MVIDIVIGITLVIALFVGYQRGVVQPLLAEIFFLGTLVIIIRDRHAYSEAMSKHLHSNAVLDVFLALIVAVVAGYVGGRLGAAVHRMPVVRGADGFLGIFIHVGFALLISYLVLSGLVAIDNAFKATYSSATLTLAQVQQMERAVRSNSIASSIIDTRDLLKLEGEARAPNSGGARIETVSQLNQLATIFKDFIDPQLTSSRTARPILSFGHRLPFIGRVGPSDLPRRPATPVPSPAPSASAR